MRILLLCCLLCLCWRADAAAEVGAPAPGLRGPALVGAGEIDLAGLRGRVVLVDFWASWCAPCLKSLPAYESLRAEFAREDFEIVAVNVDEDPADALAFLRKVALSFPLLRDDGTRAAAWAPKTMPTSYLVDREGRIAHRHLGWREGDLDTLREQVRTLIGDRDAP